MTKFNLKNKIKALAVMGTIALTISLSQAEEPEFLSIGGGPSGGTFNVVATGLGDLLRTEFKDTLIDVQPGGSGPNLLRVSGYKVDVGITSASNATNAWMGEDPTTPDKPIKNVRGLMTFFPSAIQIWVSADSDIKSVLDLKGKQISAGQPGQTSWNAFINLLKVYDMSIADIESNGGKLHKLSWKESQNALRNGQLDAVMWVALYPHTTVLATETARKIRVVSLDEEKIDEYLLKYGGGFEKVTLPAGLYQGQKSPAFSVGTKTFLFTNDKTSNETAYRITKHIWNNLAKFKTVHSLLNYIDKDTAGRDMAIPLHSGALKFYNEQGIATSKSVLK